MYERHHRVWLHVVLRSPVTFSQRHSAATRHRGTTLEASPYDRIWGIGLAASDPRARDEQLWRGQNLLGKILTRLRDELGATH